MKKLRFHLSCPRIVARLLSDQRYAVVIAATMLEALRGVDRSGQIQETVTAETDVYTIKVDAHRTARSYRAGAIRRRLSALSAPRIAFGDVPLRSVFHQKIDKGSEP
jgi:hypothetical protein